MLDELGLDGSIVDAVEHGSAPWRASPITTDLAAPGDGLSDAPADGRPADRPGGAAECPQARAAPTVAVAHALDGDDWVLEVRDDGRGFDVGAVAARGRRNFGLQFMRERAELIGARFEVRSRPDGGTVVRLAIPPWRAEETG